MTRVAVIATGSELLRGRGLDTHLGLYARGLEKIGLEIAFHSTCADDLGRLVDEIKLAAARADIVLLSGGLGPTEDDLTRAAAAEAFHRDLEFRPWLWKAIRDRFRRYRIRLAAINRRQAFAPKGSISLPNPNGSAPGFALRADGLLFAALPGPPREMVPMFERHVLPLIRRILRPRKDFDLYEAKAIGIPEGDVDEAIRRIAARHGTSYGITVKDAVVSICVRAAGPDRAARLRAVARDFRRAMGRNWMCDGERSLEEVVVERLARDRTTIAIAESCTGGLIASRLTDVPGASNVLLEACVTYSNESKVSRLGVRRATLAAHGAVSGECAREMAEGIARTGGAAVGVATTGIAGPEGGSKEKPVGLVFHAVHYRGRTAVLSRVFPGGRTRVKERASTFALDMVRRLLG